MTYDLFHSFLYSRGFYGTFLNHRKRKEGSSLQQLTKGYPLRNKLWSKQFTAVISATLLLSWAFYALMPTLPI